MFAVSTNTKLPLVAGRIVLSGFRLCRPLLFCYTFRRISVSIFANPFAEFKIIWWFSCILSSWWINATQQKTDNKRPDPERKRFNVCLLFVCFCSFSASFIFTVFTKLFWISDISTCFSLQSISQSINQSINLYLISLLNAVLLGCSEV